ncbi:phage terminase large subunit family protein [Desulfuromonas sp. TF]|uniref:phage terminase large subunit family protein n=1 Tax=Desulfuromonas sp. TF TaxID=1232410 RepID=UPI00040CFB17|nr:terminase gpA endonuclease subunit [Desulfuromonas sp. TF]
MSNAALKYTEPTGRPIWTEGEGRIFKRRDPTTPSRWNSKNRVVVQGSRPGLWRPETVPYAPEVLDTIGEKSVERVVMCWTPQTAKTDIANGFLGYVTDYAPGPALVVMPDKNLCKRVSKNRLLSMLENSPRLAELITDNPDDKQTYEVHLKNGADWYLSWASSPAMLSMISIRYLFRDEIDKWAEQCGKETDPLKLSFVRTNVYRGKRKIVDSSTPTLTTGPIWLALNACSEIRDYWVACPLCGGWQKMTFDRIKWPAEEKDPEAIKDGNLAWYECADCGEAWDDHRRDQAVRAGSWVARKKAKNPKSVGFHLPAWYSPFVSLSECAAAYVEARPVREGKIVNRLAWINFLNQYAAEAYKEEEGEVPEWEKIQARAENYGPAVPMRAGVLTAFADVQDDRLEVEVVAWGRGEEAWSIDRHIIPGVPVLPSVWQELDRYLRREWRHESGAKMRIASAGVDTGGHYTKQAYAFVKKRYHRRIYGTKGSSVPGKGIVGRPTKSNLGKIPLFIVGTETAKETIFSRLNLDQGEEGFIHFPQKYDEEYYKQLISEKPSVKHYRGRPVRVFVQTRERNETLDLWVGNLAILSILNPNLEKLVRDLERQAQENAQGALDLGLEEDPADQVDQEEIEEVAEGGSDFAKTVAETAVKMVKALNDLKEESDQAGESHSKTRTARGRRRSRSGSFVGGFKK